MTRETLESVRAKMGHVGACVSDPEAAHAAEDVLHQYVLRAIADGILRGENAQRAALMALSTQELGFTRWYA